jgi:hypothetical protein
MIRLDERSAVSALLVAVAAAFLAGTVGLSPTARLVPLTVVVPTLALAVAQLALDLVSRFDARSGRHDRPDAIPSERVADDDIAPDDRRRHEVALLSWLLVLLGLLALVGLRAALPAFTFLFLRARAGESAALSAVVALVVLATIVALLHTLGLRDFEGLVWSLVAR